METKGISIVYATNIDELDGTMDKGDCLHLVCLEGNGEVEYGERKFSFEAHDLVILSRPEAIGRLKHSNDLRVVCLVAPLQFLYNQLPSNHFGIGGCIDLWDNPVIPLDEDCEKRLLDDFSRLNDRIGETKHLFYNELIGSLALTMVYDLFDAHARRNLSSNTSERNADLISQLIDILSSGRVKEQRNVAYYAEQLNVTPKYLGNLVKRQTGRSMMHLIDQHTVPMIREYLANTQLTITQIADLFHFTNVSYFTRYVQKHLGMTPSEYRASLQPKQDWQKE